MVTEAASGLIETVRPIIVKHEGYRLHVYKDTLGIPTIGVGFNLQRQDARTLCQQCGANYDRLLSGEDSLTPAQCEFLFSQSVIGAIEWLTVRVFPKWKEFSIRRQAALTDMVFNLGQSRFSQFHQMISAINLGDWDEASTQAMHSEWATQVGER